MQWVLAKAENRGVVVTEAGSYLRLMDSCITQLKAQGLSRTCNKSKEEEKAMGQRWALTSLRAPRQQERRRKRRRELGRIVPQGEAGWGCSFERGGAAFAAAIVRVDAGDVRSAKVDAVGGVAAALHREPRARCAFNFISDNILIRWF